MLCLDLERAQAAMVLMGRLAQTVLWVSGIRVQQPPEPQSGARSPTAVWQELPLVAGISGFSVNS
jgi:hypothetical protein